jgi:ClpP class serine protease
MLRITCDSAVARDRARQIVSEIETKLDRRLYCLYQDMTVESAQEQLYYHVVGEARTKLQKIGRVPKLTVLLESPGGNQDHAYRLVRTFRRFADSLEVIVVSWAKSGATFFCLGADKIFLRTQRFQVARFLERTCPRGS